MKQQQNSCKGLFTVLRTFKANSAVADRRIAFIPCMLEIQLQQMLRFPLLKNILLKY